MLVALVAIVLTLFLVIGIHEAGHALAARIFKVKIKRIAIGFGPAIVKWQSKSGCEWVIGVWLLGGYVHLSNTRNSNVPLEQQTYCFDKKPVGQRIIILLAGSAANFIVAWLAFIAVLYCGMYYKMPQIAQVQANSIAARAGINAQEQFIAINNQKTPSWQAVGQELIIAWGHREVPVTLKRVDGTIQLRTLDLSGIAFASESHSLLEQIGLSINKAAPQQLYRAHSLLDALHAANQNITHLIYFFFNTIKQLVLGVIPLSVLLGPLGLLVTSINSLTQGIVVFSFFIAHLSVAVAVLNLLPLPSLDGGSIVYALVEKVRGTALSIAWELLLYRLMLVVLFLLLVQLVKNDLIRFYG